MFRSRCRWPRTTVLVAASCLLAVPALHAQSLKAKTYLVRPDPAPDEDAVGKLKLVSKPGDQEFDLDLRHVDGAETHIVYLETAPGSLDYQEIGIAVGDEADGDDKLELEFETDDGDTLPFGVDSVEQLLGRGLKVEVNDEVILFTTLPADLTEKGKFKAVNTLVRAADSPDPDARGIVAMVSEPGKGRERFGIIAKLVDGLATHDLYMDDGTGSIELVGPLGGYSNDADDDGDPEVEFEAETKYGQALPLGVQSVTELLGRRVEVQLEGGEVVLFGTIPDTFDDDDDDDMEIEIDLERADGADEDAEGEVELEIKKNGNEEFEAEAERIDITLLHKLYVENDVGVMVHAGDMAPDFDDIDQLLFATDNKLGEALPFGVARASDLFGRRIEIRQQNNNLNVLEGYAPGQFITQKINMVAYAPMDPVDPGPGQAVGKLRVKARSHMGDERFEIRVNKLDFVNSTFHLWMESAAGSNAMFEVTEIQRTGKKRGRLRLRTREGAALPLGVQQVVQLAGRRVEIRDESGKAHLVSYVPDPRSN